MRDLFLDIMGPDNKHPTLDFWRYGPLESDSVLFQQIPEYVRAYQ